MTERETLKKWLDESNNIVFFGGAGVSTESNIPDFRSTDGLYNDLKPFLLYEQTGGVLPLLPKQDAVPQREAEPGP